MNKIIESSVEENLQVLPPETKWPEQDLESEDMDMATAIFDAHDDPC